MTRVPNLPPSRRKPSKKMPDPSKITKPPPPPAPPPKKYPPSNTG